MEAPKQRRRDYTSNRQPNVWDKRWEKLHRQRTNPRKATTGIKHNRIDKRDLVHARQEVAVMDALVNGPRTVYQIMEATGLNEYVTRRALRRLQGLVKGTEKGRWYLSDN